MHSILQRAASMLLVCATMPAYDMARAQDEVPPDRIEAVLARAGQAGQGSPSHLAREILGLGANAVERSFDALARELETGDAQAPSSPRTRVLLAVFEQAGAARWRPVVDHRLGAAPTRGGLVAVLTVIGQDGNAQDVETLLRAARTDAEGVCRAEFEQALTDVLVRDENGFSVLEVTIPLGVPSVCASVVAGVEGTRRMRAAQLLARWIDGQKVLRLSCLQHLSRLVLSLPKPLPEDLAIGLRALLDRGDSETLPELLVCLGRMEDDESIPGFMRWLKEGNYAVRQNALWALQYTTRLTFGEDHKAWSTWWTDESAWWSNESTAVFSRLRRGTKAEQAAALNAISVRRTGRHRLAAEVAPALRDPDADIACLAAVELGKLGSPLAVDELLEALESPTPTLVAAAHQSLEQIAKRPLPPEPAACRAILVPLP